MSIDTTATRNRKQTPAKFISNYLWVLTICSVLGLFGSFYWIFDLFNHFRPNAFIASVIFCGLTFFFDRKHLTLAVTVTCLNAGLLIYALWAFDTVADLGPPNEDNSSVQIVSSNVLALNKKYEKALEVLTKDDPDIIALTEVTDAWVAGLSALDEVYPYTVKHPRPDSFGMAIYSKRPFNADIKRASGRRNAPLGVLEFLDFDLIVAHPLPPVSASHASDNRIYIDTVGKLASLSDKPVIVAGDLNSSIWANSLKPLRESNLERVPLGLFSYTWPIRLAVIGVQIDHFFAHGITGADGQVLSGIGSDHYPIQAVFNISGEAPDPAGLARRIEADF